MASRSCPQLLGHLHICHVWAPNASVPPPPSCHSRMQTRVRAHTHTHTYMHTHTHLQPPWLHSAGTHDSSAASLVKRSSGQLTSRELEGLHFPSTPLQSPFSSSPTAHTCRAQTPPRSAHPTAVCLSLLSSSSSAPELVLHSTNVQGEYLLPSDTVLSAGTQRLRPQPSGADVLGGGGMCSPLCRRLAPGEQGAHLIHPPQGLTW